MSFLPYAVAGWLFLVGLWGVVSSRNLIHLAVCLTVMQSSTYVLLLGIGYKNKGTAPIFNEISQTHVAVDPVVQSLTLTDVVVSVTVLALILALALQGKRKSGTLDPDELVELRG